MFIWVLILALQEMHSDAGSAWIRNRKPLSQFLQKISVCNACEKYRAFIGQRYCYWLHWCCSLLQRPYRSRVILLELGQFKLAVRSGFAISMHMLNIPQDLRHLVARSRCRRLCDGGQKPIQQYIPYVIRNLNDVFSCNPLLSITSILYSWCLHCLH